MAKKKEKNEPADDQRKSRKDELREQKQAEQIRQIRIAAVIVAVLLGVVLLVALVNEFFIAPNREVATVNSDSITLGEFQERVKVERAQRIIGLENQLEAVGGDVGTLQQFAGQTILDLQDSEGLGQATIDRMVEEIIIRQEAEARGISVDAAVVDEWIASSYNYFGGESPTPLPEPTETIAPTPSVTLIPTAVITDIIPTAVPAPTLEPAPTSPPPTPVSEEYFQQELNDLLGQLKDLGVSESSYRELIAARIYQEELMDAVAEEQAISPDALQANLLILAFNDEAEANEAFSEANSSDFLTVWNTVRSQPADLAAENQSTANAVEFTWRTQTSLEQTIGAEAAELAFTLPIDVPSTVLQLPGSEDNPTYLIIMVNGRESRPMPEQEYEELKQAALIEIITAVMNSDAVNVKESWRSRIPTVPVLDAKFLAAATATPVQVEPETGTPDTQ
ncbi:MAG: SurA N-terminal domain-containing protein [Anaerolineales bacterium]|nr:SurA N-terminal domain-containing protein [Anaerolineales bacterium]